MKRFGNYELELSAVPTPIADDLAFEISSPKKLGRWLKPTRKRFRKRTILRDTSWEAHQACFDRLLL
jgi:hypothetical protein